MGDAVAVRPETFWASSFRVRLKRALATVQYLKWWYSDNGDRRKLDGWPSGVRGVITFPHVPLNASL